MLIFIEIPALQVKQVLCMAFHFTFTFRTWAQRWGPPTCSHSTLKSLSMWLGTWRANETVKIAVFSPNNPDEGPTLPLSHGSVCGLTCCSSEGNWEKGGEQWQRCPSQKPPDLPLTLFHTWPSFFCSLLPGPMTVACSHSILFVYLHPQLQAWARVIPKASVSSFAWTFQKLSI